MSFGNAGAFDCVPHGQLIQAQEEAKIDAHIRRVAHFWLGDRTFQVEMETAEGVTRFSEERVSRGLPRGGGLSPPLWLLFFDKAVRELQRKREEIGEELGTSRDFQYADEISAAITAHTGEELRSKAGQNVEWLGTILQAMSLKLNERKFAT